MFFIGFQRGQIVFFLTCLLVEAAGGLVRNLETNHYLFIFRNKKWDLLKEE